MSCVAWPVLPRGTAVTPPPPRTKPCPSVPDPQDLVCTLMDKAIEFFTSISASNSELVKKSKGAQYMVQYGRATFEAFFQGAPPSLALSRRRAPSAAGGRDPRAARRGVGMRLDRG